MRWSDVDLDRAVWTIPSEAEKTGETRGDARKVALSTVALELLADQRQQSMARGRGRSMHVFPGEGGGPTVGSQTLARPGSIPEPPPVAARL